MLPSRRRPVAAAALAASCAIAAQGFAADCRPSTGYSGCIDSNVLWPSPGQQQFFSIASPSAPRARSITFGFQSQALFRPLTLEVPGPTTEAREVRLVDRAIDATWLFDAGLGHGLSLGAVFGVVLAQWGAGIEGITSQRGAPLERSAPRDPRVRLAFAHRFDRLFAVAPRLELTLPLGDEKAFASSGSLTFAPGVALESGFSRFHVGVDAAFRVRRAVELGTGRYGSQLALAAGASFDLITDSSLFIAYETFALIPLIDSTSARGRALGVESHWIPAEWLLSVGLRPLTDSGFSLVLGAGSGLALSTDVGAAQLRYFAPTTPLLRALLALRFFEREEGP